jgi:hypothetical protein
MAECPSTDLVQRTQPSTGRNCQRTGARFRPTEATLTGSSKEIDNEADEEQNCERRSEQEFCRQQLPHEVHLKNKSSRDRPPESAVYSLLLDWFICKQ